jgi:hypothetical protein
MRRQIDQKRRYTMALNQHATIIARQLTKEQKRFLSNFIDPHQRGEYKRSCAAVNQSYIEEKMKKGKKKDKDETGAEE